MADATSEINPSDAELLRAVYDIRTQQPRLGRKKLRPILQEKYHFNVTEHRMKEVVPASLATGSDEPLQAIAQRLEIPSNPLEAQIKYIENSARTFKIYGRGEHNYGVTLNDMMSGHFRNAYYESKEQAQDRPAAEASAVVWDYYVAAANNVGVTKTEIGAQFEMELGVPWKSMPVSEVGRRHAVLQTSR